MLTREEDIDAHALHKQGWTISAIARHLGRDRKTIRAYLAGQRAPGVRTRTGPDRFAEFETYCRARLGEDPHLWAVTLFDEVTALGCGLSYSSFTRELRDRSLRPACEPCRPAKGRPVAIIDHPPGAETQWDWLELPDPPGHWDGYRGKAYLLLGALSHSGRWRAVLAESTEQPQLCDGLHRVAVKLGGLTRTWRFDRMSTVYDHHAGQVNRTFAQVAKHYAVSVALCPPRRGNRKGVVEKGCHTAAQRWWRNLPDNISLAAAEASLDRHCQQIGDSRRRVDVHGSRFTVADLAAAEGLRPIGVDPFPATLSVSRTVRPQALVAFRGNHYSVPPELVGATVTVSTRLGSATIDIATTSPAGLAVVIARHRRAADGAGVTVRTDSHVTALNAAALAAFSTAPAHRSKVRIPPGPAARAEAERLRARQAPTAAARATAPGPATDPSSQQVVTDLAVYAAAALTRRSLP